MGDPHNTTATSAPSGGGDGQICGRRRGQEGVTDKGWMPVRHAPHFSPSHGIQQTSGGSGGYSHPPEEINRETSCPQTERVKDRGRDNAPVDVNTLSAREDYGN